MSKLKRRSIAGQADERTSIVEHFEQVQVRIEELIKYSKGMVSLLKKRIQIDKEHVKVVQKLGSAIHDDTQYRNIKFDGLLESHWSTVKETIQSEAMHLSSIVSTLERQALQPLQVFLLTDLEKRFRSVAHDGHKAVKELLSARAALQKAKEKYHGSASEWEGCLLVLFREYGDTWNPTPGNKLYEREQQLCKKMAEARSEYEVTVSHVNSLQHDVLLNQLPQDLQTLRTVVENMVAVVNNALKSFSEMQTLFLSGVANEKSGLNPHEQFHAATYAHKAIFASISVDDIPPPVPHEFDEFVFKDQSMMVQARKVQYECMSKLSPKELATRGHQFFAEADKRERESPTSPNSLIKGLNVYLVELCLEYLQQPLPLREEGLFRVPGDAAVIRALHADFLSGRASREFLRQSVMDQRDPNNVSGLLKLHLRENSLLCSDSMELVQKAMESMDSLVDTLVVGLPSLELVLLTRLVGVFSELCQEPWKSENKMTPRTLGIACGLSIFPDLEPGKATNLVDFLVRNYETLQHSHTEL